MKTFDVIVAGVGSMGSAACDHLARRGVRVLGLEQFDLPHDRGSHHGHSRMIRQSYYEHPDYVPLLRRAYELWEDLNEVLARADEEPVFHRTGGLYLGPADGEIVPGALESARRHGLSHELLDAAEVERRFPAFRVRDNFSGFYEQAAGFLVPEAAVAASAERAQHHGAEIRTGEPLLDWQSSGEGVVVRTAFGTYHADHLVITAGAWSDRVLGDLEVELRVTRQVLAWFDPQGVDEGLMAGDFPCWFIESESPYGHYGFPLGTRGQRGLKIALHKPGEVIAPEDLGGKSGQATEEEIESLRDILRQWIPSGHGPLLATRTCLYTNTPDSHFVVGAHPLAGNVTIAAGFSGHGFKFASVMGEVLADLACSGATSHAIEFLSPERFGR